MKILIVDGHPNGSSFSNAISLSYERGARKVGHQVKLIHLRDLKFDPILHFGYQKKVELEEDLKNQQEHLKWCQHLVVVFPLWWMGFPALLKGYLERVFLPKFAFVYRKGKLVPERLLKGRSARIIYTQGSPKWATKLFFLNQHWRILKKGVFWFVGFDPVKRTVFDRIGNSSERRRKGWLKKVYRLGEKGA